MTISKIFNVTLKNKRKKIQVLEVKINANHIFIPISKSNRSSFDIYKMKYFNKLLTYPDHFPHLAN